MRVILRLSLMIVFGLLASACTETQLAAHIAKQIPMPGDTPDTTGDFKVGSSYVIKGKRYYPKESYNHSEVGMASWYGPGFHGKLTANGEIYDQYALTAAHRTLQMPSLVEVTNLSNGRSLVLRVNDRGPFAHNRVIDVSKKAAELLGFRQNGVAKVRVRVLPGESRKIAMMAKAGRSTAGTEVAMNRSGTLDEFHQIRMASTKPVRKPVTESTRQVIARPVAVEREEKPIMISRAQPVQATPVPVTAPRQVMRVSAPSAPTPASKPMIKTAQMQPIIEQDYFYVNADTLRDMDEAETLRLSLSQYGRTSIVPTIEDGQAVYRIKVGPVNNRAQAEALLAQIRAIGRDNSTITVAKR